MVATKLVGVKGAEALALAKLFNDDAAKELREAVKPGSYEIEEALKITGVLVVAPDHTAMNAQRLCPWSLVLIMMERMKGVTIDEIVKEAARRARLSKPPDTSDLKSKTELAAAKLMGATAALRKGAAKWEGIVIAK